jgi:hypothetical protein
MTQALVVLRTGEFVTQDVPGPSVSTTGAVARGADASHVDSAVATTHVDSAAVLPAAAQMSAPAPSSVAAVALPAATFAPESSSIQSSNPVVSTIASDSHTDAGSAGVVGRSASFELPFTHEVASGSDAVTYVTQDDGSIVATDAGDSGLANDWTIIV